MKTGVLIHHYLGDNPYDLLVIHPLFVYDLNKFDIVLSLYLQHLVGLPRKLVRDTFWVNISVICC